MNQDERTEEPISEEQAKEDLAKIWDPYSLDQWANFIETAQKNHATM